MNTPLTATSHVITDVGKVRQNNEDNFLVLDNARLFVVADGMGGHANGEIASRICVDAIAEAYSNNTFRETVRERYRKLRKDEGYNKPFAQYELTSAVEYSNYAIYQTASRDPGLRDMGTTVVCMQLVGQRVYLSSVGDSRIYRWRDGKLAQLTEDHSLANEYVKLRLLKLEDVSRFPYKNVIVRALGLGEHVEVDTLWRRARGGDRYMLCSDGLSDLVADPEVEQIMARADGPQQASRELVDIALAYGGVDNVTVLSVWVDEQGSVH